MPVAPVCELCGLPHERIVVNGVVLCPEKDGAAYTKALESWRGYNKQLRQRWKDGR